MNEINEMHIKVKVVTGAKKEKFTKISPDTFEVSVKEKAERNIANKRIRELLAEHFEIPIGKIRMIKGHRSPSKIFEIKK